MNSHISRKFKMPTIKAYDGIGNPDNHSRTFPNYLLLHPVNDAIKCWAFPQTLSGMAQRWYSCLPPNSVGSFKDLSQDFIKQFISGRVHEKSSASLMGLVQGAKESLRYYQNRFTKEALKIPDLDDKLQDRAGKYIKVEESVKKTVVNNEPASNKKRKTDQEYDASDKYPRTGKGFDSSSKKNQTPRFTEYARLNAPRSQILMEIEKDKEFKWPNPLRGDPKKRDKGRYCRYHKDIGHDIDDCRQLKDEIVYLIRRGNFGHFTKGEKARGQKEDNDRRDDNRRGNDKDHNPQPLRGQ
ncbi:uncharacterized protein LOC141714642 [Apium graveolens]|uniref:uncharacterized protein LOC141714642 n=1 Tax=Apium graveolens TaxID=4045 RepID=UPI003D795CFB